MICMPFPPSVNRLWRNVRGRTLLSSEGRKYRNHAIAATLMSRSMVFGDAQVEISISAWLPDNRRRDADNLFKAPLDALVAAGVLDDDSQIVALSIRKAGIDRENPRLEVTVTFSEEV